MKWKKLEQNSVFLNGRPKTMQRENNIFTSSKFFLFAFLFSFILYLFVSFLKNKIDNIITNAKKKFFQIPFICCNMAILLMIFWKFFQLSYFVVVVVATIYNTTKSCYFTLQTKTTTIIIKSLSLSQFNIIYLFQKIIKRIFIIFI